VDPQRLSSAGSVYLTRPALAHYVATREELTWRAAEVFDAILDGSLRIIISGRYPLAEASAPTRTCRVVAPPASSCCCPTDQQELRVLTYPLYKR
jgi:hypothetical protein